MENNKNQKITTPIAIVVAGILIMVGLLLTGGINGKNQDKDKTLSEQVGASKEKLTECLKNTNTEALQTKIQTSVENAMKALPADQRGTPYSIIIGKNGSKTEIRGASSIENVKKLIDEVTSGNVTKKYEGEVPPVDADDHIMGNIDAPVVIVEYSDYECPYCKAFQATLDQVVAESNGNVAWVYRHWPIHQNSIAKLMAAECISQIKGNDAFWKYSDLLFSLLKTNTDAVTDQL